MSYSDMLDEANALSDRLTVLEANMDDTYESMIAEANVLSVRVSALEDAALPSDIHLHNITTLRSLGWSIPPESEWWNVHPTPDAIKSSIIDPWRNDPGGAGICVKRLWIHRVLVAGEFDAAQMNAINATANSMHRNSLAAHWHYDVRGEAATGDLRMASAKTAFYLQCNAQINNGTRFTSFLVSSTGTRDVLAAVFALDWINWDTVAEYETAFDLVRRLVDINIGTQDAGSRNFLPIPGDSVGEGYGNATHYSGSAHFVKSMLAITSYGVNPSGASGVYASDIIDRMVLNPTNDDQATFSFFQATNFLNLLSLGNGGGREWGAHDSVTSLGGYELNLAFFATVALKAFDTATDSVWSMVDKSLYLQTRWIGLCAIEDIPVEATGFHDDCGAMVEIWSRMFAGTDAGARYKWLSERSNRHSNANSAAKMRVLHVLSGVKPTAVAPTGVFADRVGSRWYYQAERSAPDTTFRLMAHIRSLDNHREVGSASTHRFAIGGIGLVEGHCNRCYANEVVSNGVWVGNASSVGDPLFAQSGATSAAWWSQGATKGVYHTSDRAGIPMPVATDPLYLVGNHAKPVLSNGIYIWSVDWSSYCGTFNGSAVVSDARWTQALAEYSLDPALQKLTIDYTMTVDLTDGLYLGWHFSPSVLPDLLPDGFSFTDSIDAIKVTVTSLGSFGFTRTMRTRTAGFHVDRPYLLGMEWHDTANGGSLRRIAANVGYRPDTVTPDNVYRVRVTLEANPTKF